MARRFGVETRLLPMTDDRVETRVTIERPGSPTDVQGSFAGLAAPPEPPPGTSPELVEIGFQEYFVGLRHDVAVKAVRFVGASVAVPAPGVLDAIEQADLVVICPSNPIVSIGPVLAVPGIADAVARRRETTVAVSPIIAGKALKGPADRMLDELGYEASAVGVAKLWAPFAATLVVDVADSELAPGVEAQGTRCIVAPSVMSGAAQAQAPGRSRPRGTAVISVFPVEGLPEVGAGDEIADLVLGAARLEEHDVLVITQKIVSKAEGRVVPIDPADPQARRRLVLSESVRVLRERDELIISETRHGFVCANAGVDLSNVGHGQAALLPLDPDRSARHIRDALRARSGLGVAVIISDTFGRAWRHGLTDVAIGCAGIAAVVDLRGTTDATGRELAATEVCVVDEIASAAELAKGKATGLPVVVVRGVDPAWFRESSVKAEIVRPYAGDLFR